MRTSGVPPERTTAWSTSCELPALPLAPPAPPASSVSEAIERKRSAIPRAGSSVRARSIVMTSPSGRNA
ncbi:MAG: hypothetical protein IPF92_31090 [Myxococcales bacterium]|nr:hypothetical protein [Myxococcales bacterium]